MTIPPRLDIRVSGSHARCLNRRRQAACCARPVTSYASLTRAPGPLPPSDRRGARADIYTLPPARRSLFPPRSHTPTRHGRPDVQRMTHPALRSRSRDPLAPLSRCRFRHKLSNSPRVAKIAKPTSSSPCCCASANVSRLRHETLGALSTSRPCLYPTCGSTARSVAPDSRCGARVGRRVRRLHDLANLDVVDATACFAGAPVVDSVRTSSTR